VECPSRRGIILAEALAKEGPVENPYESSSATVPSSPRRWKDKAHTVVSVLIAAFGVLQFVVMMLISAAHLGSRYADALPLSQLAFGAFLSSSLLLGGITLVLRRRICVFFFAAFLVAYVMKNGTTEAFSPSSVAFGFAFLAYASWRWKLGHLKGWPGG
jgi:amino acid permease